MPSTMRSLWKAATVGVTMIIIITTTGVTTGVIIIIK